jgi:hypothetical protein
MQTLKIAEGLTLPLDAVTQKFAFIARSGAGKTYASGKLAEELLDAGAQIVVLDPVGSWWGLRIGADDGDGFPIPVFGGEHGDIPLGPDAGDLVADTIVDRGISAVLDVSNFTQGERKRFVTAFAERLFHRKKTSRGPLHLFLEEAQVFIPQRVQKGEERMLGAFESIGKIGRNYGIGITLISQRPQAIHKDVLNQTEALFVGQVNGAHERKALDAWITDVGGDRKLVDELPKLPIGTMFLWSPQWLRKFEKVKIGKKRTADVSATPTFGAKPIEARPLAAVDLAELRDAMKAAVEEQEANDPKLLHKRIRELEKKLVKASATRPSEVHGAVDITRLQLTAERLQHIAAEATRAADDVLGVVRAAFDGKPVVPNSARGAAPAAASPRNSTGNVGTVYPKRTQFDPSTAPSMTPSSLGKGERAILTAIAQHGDRGVTREHLTVLTGYRRSSRDTYLQRLRSSAYVEQRGDSLTVTPQGLIELGAFEALPTGKALRDHWMRELPEGERVILGVLLDAYPADVERDSLDVPYKRSSRDTYLQRLSARQLIVTGRGTGRGTARASDALFDRGRR